MKPSDYLKTYMRNSINPARFFRPYIPGYAWPQDTYKPWQKKKRKLCLKEYKRFINRKKYRNWHVYHARKRRKMLRRIGANGIKNYIDSQLKGTFFQPLSEIFEG